MTRRPSRRRRDLTLADLQGRRFRPFIRESTKRQTKDDRYGPAIQRTLIGDFLKNEYSLVYPDDGYFEAASATSARGRSELQRALDDADEYDVLVFAYSSRSFRNRHEAATWKPRFRAAGVEIVYADTRIISGTERDNLAEGVHELVDDDYSRKLSATIHRAARAKFERGGVNGKPPLGYKRFHGEPGEPQNGSLIIDEKGAATARRIYELYLTGDESYPSIAMTLNCERDPDGSPAHITRLGRPFTKGSVEEILRNRTYVGDTVWAPGTPEEEAREGTHQGIIPRADFARVETIRQARANGGGRHLNDHIYPLSGAVCDTCAAPYHGELSGRNCIRRLRHKVGVACDGRRSFKSQQVEDQFGEIVQERLRLPTDVITQCRRLLAKAPDKQADAAVAQRAAIEDELRRLTNLYRWRHIDEEEYRRERALLQRHLQDLAPNLEPTPLVDVKRAAELLQNLGEMWFHEGTTLERQQAFINEIREQVWLDDAGICAVQLRDEYLPLAAVAEAPTRGREVSGWADSNRRPRGPKPRALARLSYTPAFGSRRRLTV